MAESEVHTPRVDAASLAASVLDEEARRQEEQSQREQQVLLPDDLLPGVGDEAMSLRDAMNVGGRSTLILLFLLGVVDEFPRAIRVLAPDIQESLGVSDTVLLGVLGFGGVTLVLGAVPMAALADRVNRVAIIPFMSVAWAITTFFSGMVVNAFQLFWTNAASGFGQAYRIPVSNSLLADTYPIQARSRVYALESMSRPLGQLIGPLLVGSVAVIAGGVEGWRWAFFVIAVPPVIIGLAASRMPNPPRGQFDQSAVLDSGPLEVAELEPSMSTALARLRKIRTFYYLATGVGVLGFALIAVPIQFNLLLEDRYGMDALERGIIEASMWVASLIAIPIAGRLFDRTFRKDPEQMVRTAGAMVMAAGLLFLVALPIKTLGLLIVMMALAQATISASFVAAPTIIAAVSPYRIRSQAFALLPVFVFLMGGFLGGLVTGQISDAYSERTAMLVIAPPAALIGGWLIRQGSRFIRRDISMAVEELLEEQKETAKILESPETVPVLQVNNLDFSYGPVQVLFNVGFEVGQGEVVALLGTNGAGKSTLLRAISGLGIPDRGVVRLNGRTITYAEAETRFRVGIVQLRGGAGTFHGLTIADNLRASLLASKLDPDEIERRVESAVSRFPALAERLGERADDLSGGQQQMLALAMALAQEPEILLIDELSLGLAPVVVQQLLEVIEELKAEGQAMVIVEQSLNVALAFADRAVFMEKGQVRFEGPAAELLERGDLVRAVFLGGGEG
jgi:ABC-type branched-subunit amino acid transport system ATPase component/predicted MFS family arabinose efflux permease